MASTDRAKPSNGPVRGAAVVCAIVLACAALYFASSVFAPLAFALFILAIVWPLQQRLEQAMPKGLALFVTLTVTVVVVVIFAFDDRLGAQRRRRLAVEQRAAVPGALSTGGRLAGRHGIFVAGSSPSGSTSCGSCACSGNRQAPQPARRSFSILVFVFLMMALLEVRQFGAKLASLRDGDRLADATAEIAAKFRR